MNKSKSVFSAPPEWWASISSSFSHGHPWFDLTWLGASDRSAGKNYRRRQPSGISAWSAPRQFAGITVEECKPGNAPQLLFSAMDASVATEIEQAFAQAGHVVVSNSRNHRMESDVPLLVPEINPDHLKLVPGQQRARGWKGQIVTNPNCSTDRAHHGAGAAEAVRHHQNHRHHYASYFRRGLPGRRRPWISWAT